MDRIIQAIEQIKEQTTMMEPQELIKVERLITTLRNSISDYRTDIETYNELNELIYLAVQGNK